MQLLSLLAVACLTADATARSAQHVGKKYEMPRPRPRSSVAPAQHKSRDTATLVPQTEKTAKFAVNGSAGAIPGVDFTIGESYAGLLPISAAANESSSLYFWYFPSANPAASSEITIWLNGGPGCSSLEGFLQENGPISWQYGTPRPVYNPWNWANLTNMVWVEQPVGTGFSQGMPTATSTEEAAQQFLGWWEQFVGTFALEGRKVYIAGESYAGKYIPYFAEAMLEREDERVFDVKGVLIYDPSVASDTLLEDVPAVPYLDHWAGLFNLNETFTADIHARADKCGYTEYINTHLRFPPKGPLPEPTSSAADPECAIWSAITDAVFLTNPCFDIYQIATTCPLLWDVLGFPGSFGYLPEGETVYFNRSDVQKAINAPLTEWNECSNGVLDTDTSPSSSYTALPHIIDRLDRTIIVHADLDWILLANGTLLAIQNMTWGGVQGFQQPPSDDFFVPYHAEASQSSLSAAGIMGVTRTERKFTFVEQRLSGHMVPQYQPSSAYRQLEFLLGRIESLASTVPFTPMPGGNATAGVRSERGVAGRYEKWV